MHEVIQPPDDIEFHTADGVFVKRMVLYKAGTLIPQHAHKYAHNSFLASGSIRVWQDDVLKGDFKAPACVLIAAGVKHKFLSLEDNTIVDCIHNVMRTGEVEVLEEHQLEN